MAKVRAVPLADLPQETITAALDFIAENLRPSDLDEVKATTADPPREALGFSVGQSDLCWLILDRTGLPMGVMGVAPSHHPKVGVPWLIGTPGLEEEGIAVLRQTRKHVDQMQELYPVLTNFVDARNDTSIGWLLWAGFRLIDADLRHGPEKRLFIQFSKSR